MLAGLPSRANDRSLGLDGQGRRRPQLVSRPRARHHLGGRSTRASTAAIRISQPQHPRRRRRAASTATSRAESGRKRRVRPCSTSTATDARRRHHRRRAEARPAELRRPALRRRAREGCAYRSASGVAGPAAHRASRRACKIVSLRVARRQGRRPVERRHARARVHPREGQRRPQAAARPRRQPERRLRVRRRDVRLRPEPALRRGRPAGQSGVVVVVAAGNTGYGDADRRRSGSTKVGLSNTINDPGNAELAITVGSTHRDAPHTYGVSYFSSKGPTGDGRAQARPGRARASASPRAPPGGTADMMQRRRAGAEAHGAALLRRRQRHEHGGAARLGRDRGVPVDPPGVHRPAARRSSGSSSRARRRSAASATSRATAWWT